MPRKQHTYHYIYKTTNLVNDKFYIGMHSTSNLEDGYIGSGKRLWYSIKKYGRENFKMEILEFLPDRNSLKEREREIVNSDLVKEELCMNLQIGGGGGLTTSEHRKKFQEEGRKKFLEKLKDPVYKANFSEKVRQNNVEKRGKGLFKNEHTKNTHWITNGEINKLVKLEKLEEFLLLGWRRGKTLRKDIIV